MWTIVVGIIVAYVLLFWVGPLLLTLLGFGFVKALDASAPAASTKRSRN